MEWPICFVFNIILLHSTIYSVQSSKPTRNIEITAEEEKVRDPEGYSSIKAIHGILDDDHSGSIDRSESADFLAEDLKFGEKERERREKAFHENDESITVDDLWEAWFESEERGWDQKEAADWLIKTVKLPQYSTNFMNAKVVGMHLPRMAVQNSTFLTMLGIKNFVHRQKLQLKALDLVLFGSQNSSTLLKDLTLAGLLVVLVTVLIFFKTHKNRSKKQMEELATRLSKLRDMETDFEGVQQRLDDENRKRQSIADDEEDEKIETNLCPNQLQELEAEGDRRMADLNGLDGLPFSLQNLLRRTYEMESTYLNQQKLECLHEMREAKELVDKMRRKQTSIVNSLKLATGATTGTGDIDTRIFHLKTRMEKIKLAVEELCQRWADIESMCGFSITGPFGVAAAHHTQSGLDAGTLLAIKYQQTDQPPNHHHSLPAPLLHHHSSFTDFSLIEPHHQQQPQQNNNNNGNTLNWTTGSQTSTSMAAQNGQACSSQLAANHQKNSTEDPSSENGSLMNASQSSIRNKKGGNRLKQLFRRKQKS